MWRIDAVFGSVHFITLSQLGYFEQRYLDHEHGQFLSPDPIFMLDGRMTDPQHFAPYAYARNNPMVYVDENGEHPGLIIGGAALGGAIYNCVFSCSFTKSFNENMSIAGEGAAGSATTAAVFMVSKNPFTAAISGNIMQQIAGNGLRGKELLNLKNYDIVQVGTAGLLGGSFIKAGEVLGKYLPKNFGKTANVIDPKQAGKSVMPYKTYEMGLGAAIGLTEVEASSSINNKVSPWVNHQANSIMGYFDSSNTSQSEALSLNSNRDKVMISSDPNTGVKQP